MHQALYRKWRPKTFADVMGQDHITSVLKSEVSSGKISHAYIFCGPRGTGKTTCAKIISRAVNCEHPIDGNPCGVCAACRSVEEGRATDVIEMDAASNNGVDNVRDIRDGVAYSPADLKYKVYIIDEVHMLSTQAFNALLKTLEEPPEYVIFILATTEINKIPATVLSRCQRFDFHRVSQEVIAQRLRTVCEGEGIDADDEALLLIADLAQGAFRDALNMLEYCSGTGEKITEKSASELLGASSAEILCRMAEHIAEKNIAASLNMMSELYSTSRDIAVYWRELISFYRNMLVWASTRGQIKKDNFTARAGARYTVPRLMQVLGIFCEAEESMMRTPASARLFAEMALVRVCDETMNDNTDAILVRLAALEEKVASLLSGNITISPSAKAEYAQAVSEIKEEVETPAPVEAEKKEKKKTTKTTKAVKAEPEAEEKKAEPLAESKKVSPSTGRAVSLRGFADVVKKIETTEPSLASFMIGATAVEKEGKLFIYLDSDFAAQFVSDSERKDLISRTISEVLGKNYDSNIIAPVCANGEVEEYDAVDELLPQSDEIPSK